jgi:hypothetical protein
MWAFGRRGYDDNIKYVPIVESCKPRLTALTVSAASTTVTWSTVDDTPSTWGEIKFTASSGTLYYTAATQWQHSTTRDFFNQTGGDQFRLVPEQYFSETATLTSGELAGTVSLTTAKSRFATTTSAAPAMSAGTVGDLSVAGNGKYVQYSFGVPQFGSQNTIGTGSGCFWQGEDNYGDTGHFGNPGSQCCSTSSATACLNWCKRIDTGYFGPTASADLGGNPRIGYQPWTADGSGSTSYGYIRFPPGGKFRVCYRSKEGHWRQLQGTSTLHTATNATFVPKKLNSGRSFPQDS